MTKTARKQKTEANRKAQQTRARANQERQHQRSKKGGEPNQLGVLQGQNAEQGNTVDPRQKQALGKLAH